MHEALAGRPGVMRLSEPAQLKALGHEVRSRIVTLLLERDATVSQLAAALERPVGTVGHHLGVLEDAGLVEVTRTRQVRGIVEKHYGRTARLFLLDQPPSQWEDHALGTLDEARAEAHADLEAGLVPNAAIAYTRMRPDRAHAFHERLVALVDEFRSDPADGDVIWGMVVGVFPTTRRPLPDDDDGDGDGGERSVEGQP